MTPSMRGRELSRAMICAMVLLASALGAAGPAPAQQTGPATGQQRSGDATRNLFDAVQANDLAAVQASVAAGADLTARDQWGLTPVDLAVDKSYFDVAHFLLSVRNFQRSEGNPRQSAAARQPATGFSNPGPEAARAAPGVSAEQAPPAQAARPQPVRQWPANQPNPFDPALPAPGSVLPGDGVGEALRGSEHTAAAERPQVQ
jgi:hypothetical protein